MLYLKQQLEVIRKVIPACRSIALVDEPLHRNIGDHVIHAATEEFFRMQGNTVVARAHTFNYSPRWLRRKIDAETVIACSGGGHLGDLYPRHQRLREQVIADFPENRIVILPQSLYFQNKGRMRDAVAAFRRHSNLHIFLRDTDSLKAMENTGLHNIYLAPDMAHALFPVDQAITGERAHGGVLYLMRRDRETATGVKAGPEGTIRDWPDIVRPADIASLAAIAVAGQLCRPNGVPKALNRALDRCRADLVLRGFRLINGYDQILSSRLHGALMGLLLGKPTWILENLTGKSRSYYETWLIDCSDCRYGTDE